jgi:hypothetical protein
VQTVRHPLSREKKTRRPPAAAGTAPAARSLARDGPVIVHAQTKREKERQRERERETDRPTSIQSTKMRTWACVCVRPCTSVCVCASVPCSPSVHGARALLMTPRVATAENLAQLDARASQSRWSRKKASTVVPACISPCANTVAECRADTRVSTAALVARRIARSVLLLRKRNSRCSRMVTSPDRIASTRAASASTAAGGAPHAIAAPPPSPPSVSTAITSDADAAAGSPAAPACAGARGRVCRTALRNSCVAFSYSSKQIWCTSSCCACHVVLQVCASV